MWLNDLLLLNIVYFLQYGGDQDDKAWLHERHHMPATGGKAYMLLVDDILDLAKTEEYKYITISFVI